MRITSSQQMLQHIDNGGYLKLDSENKLATSSSFGHAMQKVRDAFRSLSASGRAYIENRNAALFDSMARRVADDAPAQPDNPAGIRIPASQIQQEQRNKLALRLNIIKTLASLGIPRECRGGAALYVYHALHAMQLTKGLSQEEIPEHVTRVCQSIKEKPFLQRALSCNYTLSSEACEALTRHCQTMLKGNFKGELRDGAMLPNGIHRDFASSALRNRIGTFNGSSVVPSGTQNVDFADNREALVNDAMEARLRDVDSRYVNLITMLASEKGMAEVVRNLGIDGNMPGAPSAKDLYYSGLANRVHNYSSDIDFTSTGATIHLSLDLVTELAEHDYKQVPYIDWETQPALSAGRYEMDVEIDLNQDLGDKSCPDFTVTNIRSRQIPVTVEL